MTRARKNTYTAITWGTILASLTLTFTRYADAVGRLLSAFVDLGHSVAWYFCRLFLGWTEMPFSATVLEIPDLDIQKFIPFSLEELQRKWDALGEALLQTEWMAAYLNWVSISLRKFLLVLLLLIPIVLMLWMIIKFSMLSERPAEDRNVDSKPLQIFKKLTFKPFFATKEWLLSFKSFLGDRKYLVAIFVLIWTVNLNMITIVIEAIAFYFYFASTFTFDDLGGQGLKLVIDVIIMFSGAALPFWILAFWIFFDKARRALGYDKLEHNESKNRGFINTLPIVVMLCGSMGTGKTTMLADMTLSVADMFRNTAAERMQRIQSKLPNFPWIVLEKSLADMMESEDLRNLASVRLWMSEKQRRFKARPTEKGCFCYDREHFITTYDDNLKVTDLWQELSTYAQLYFIYKVSSSLIIGNFSVRDGARLDDEGHFPLWNNEFFKTASVPLEDNSRHARIINFDALRPGAKVAPEDPVYGAIEFGVIAITEIGKERGNALENRELKKKGDAANQKSDLFNQDLKMRRHSSTVDNFPFIKVICDEQRPESWGADARDTAYVVHITGKDEQRLAMPGFLFENILYDIISPAWSKFKREYRYNRSDNTLTMFILDNVVSAFLRYRDRTYNLFGYNRLHVETEKGTLDGEREAHEYFLSSKKDYSRVFATDCFSDYFASCTLSVNKGLMDLPEYETEMASFDELRRQNSYFVAGLIGKDGKDGE